MRRTGKKAFQSFKRYRRRYREQKEFDHYCRELLPLAFEKFTKITSVIFIDWCGLARSGESYEDTAVRFFGNDLQPEELNHRLGAGF